MTALAWVQTLVVFGGTAWLLALIGIVCVGGWYAHTHPTAGRNDQVFQQIARLLRLLTFGLTGVHPLRPHLRTQTRWLIGGPPLHGETSEADDDEVPLREAGYVVAPPKGDKAGKETAHVQ